MRKKPPVRLNSNRTLDAEILPMSGSLAEVLMILYLFAASISQAIRDNIE